MRGIAYFSVSVEKKPDGTGNVIKFQLPSSQDIRRAVLLADEMNISQFSGAFAELTPDLQFLKTEGFVTESFAPDSATPEMIRNGMRVNHLPRPDELAEYAELSLADSFKKARLDSFDALCASKPDFWALDDSGETGIFSPEERSTEGLHFQILNAIPVPDGCTPLEDVLEFKAKRADELSRLRKELASYEMSMAKKLVAGGESSMEISALQNSIEDVIKASRETGFKLRLMDLYNEFKPNFSTLGMTTTILDLSTPLIATFAVAGIAADLRVAKIKMNERAENRETPYMYISRYHNDLITL